MCMLHIGIVTGIVTGIPCACATQVSLCMLHTGIPCACSTQVSLCIRYTGIRVHPIHTNNIFLATRLEASDSSFFT